LKGNNTTVIASTHAHIANDYSPAIPNPGGPNGEIWYVQEYDLGAVTISPTDVGAGLVIEFDSTAADGWVGGGTWYVYAAWLEVEYSLGGPVSVPSIVEGNSVIRNKVEGFSPIGACHGDSPIEATIEGASIFEQDS
jgi:hypothetical protein